jgi:hypothetical protein
MRYNVISIHVDNMYCSNQGNCLHLLIITLCLETFSTFLLVIHKTYNRLS